MIKDFNDYIKYIEFIESYEDELYALYTDSPNKWEKIKEKLKNSQFDVEPDNRIFLAGMEATEFYCKVNDDEDYIKKHPLLSELSEIEIDYNQDEED